MLNIVANLPGLGDIVEKGLDNLLPGQFKCVGDLLGGLLDLRTGNFVGAAKHGFELLADLKDLAQFIAKTPAREDKESCWCYEPAPPGAWRGVPPDEKPAKATAPEKPKAKEKPKAPAKTTASKETKTAEKETKETKTAATKSTTTTSATTTKTAEAFFKMSPDDFMKAIRDGKIPEDVKESPEQMRRLQAKMQHITEMNQLMTSLLMALHQMRMSVIQNVRV